MPLIDNLPDMKVSEPIVNYIKNRCRNKIHVKNLGNGKYHATAIMKNDNINCFYNSVISYSDIEIQNLMIRCISYNPKIKYKYLIITLDENDYLISGRVVESDKEYDHFNNDYKDTHSYF